MNEVHYCAGGGGLLLPTTSCTAQPPAHLKSKSKMADKEDEKISPSIQQEYSVYRNCMFKRSNIKDLIPFEGTDLTYLVYRLLRDFMTGQSYFYGYCQFK